MNRENQVEDRQEALEEMLEDYDGPGIADFATAEEERQNGRGVRVSNSLRPEGR